MAQGIHVEMWIDVTYEFCAPHYFDFTRPESEVQIRKAEHWLEYAAGYEPSHVDEESGSGKVHESPHKNDAHLKLLVRLDNHNKSADDPKYNEESSLEELCSSLSEVSLATPKPFPFPIDSNHAPLVGGFPAKRLHSDALPETKADHVRRTNVMKKSMRALKRHAEASAKKTKPGMTKPSEFHIEPRPFKKRKLDEPVLKSCMKTPALTVPRAFQLSTDQRAARKGEFGTVSKMADLSSSFTSLAEQVQKFHMKTPERFKKKAPAPIDHKPRIGLTKPKTPEFETSHRIRPPRVKSATELEEEMLAKLPKFKARPANKKILEAPSLPVLTRSTPQQPRFQVFNLKTMERALHHTAQKGPQPVMSASARKQRRRSAPGFHIPVRFRPSRPVKTTEELQLEELAKQPKFKARPLNKKIFESRGDLGVFFRTHKRQVTKPNEFKFATSERIQHQASDTEQIEATVKSSFRRLSLDSHPRKAPEAGITKPAPFHLLTEDRGAFKAAKFMEDMSKQMHNESVSRIPKANLLPLTTDFPAVPPKPAQKDCTKPEPFQLESLLRHEQELQRQAEERTRAEQEELQSRKFRAQPIQRSDAVFLPERSRKPLTEIREFEFHVDSRAVQRAEFEKKILDKKNQYLLFKEEVEALRKEEEEKFIRALRKEMIPQARPMPLFDRIFIPQRSSKALTLPVSPQFNKRHQNGPFAPQRKFRPKC